MTLIKFVYGNQKDGCMEQPNKCMEQPNNCMEQPNKKINLLTF